MEKIFAYIPGIMLGILIIIYVVIAVLLPIFVFQIHGNTKKIYLELSKISKHIESGNQKPAVPPAPAARNVSFPERIDDARIKSRSA